MKKIMVMALAAVALTACGSRNPARMEKLVELKVEDALDRVDATPKQRERVQQIAKGVLTDVAPVAKQAKASREALVEQWKATTVDAAKTHALVDSQVDAVRAFAHKVTDAMIEVHDLLTPQQRETVTKRLEDLHR